MKLATIPTTTARPDGPRPKCLRCQKPLLDNWSFDWPIDSGSPQSKAFSGFGYHGNGFFCTMRCGYQYAVDMQRRLRRLGL